MHWEETVFGCPWIKAVKGNLKFAEGFFKVFFQEFEQIFIPYRINKKVPCTVNLIPWRWENVTSSVGTFGCQRFYLGNFEQLFFYKLLVCNY